MMVHDFQPETAEQKKERIAKKEAERVFKSVSFQEAINRIADLIYKTVYTTRVTIDKDNPKVLGDVMFWIDSNHDTPMLMWSKSPNKWDKDAVILQLEIEEYHLLNSGLLRQ